MYQEFAECDSDYVFEHRSTSSKISSDGEFNDCRDLVIFDENDPKAAEFEQDVFGYEAKRI